MRRTILVLDGSEAMNSTVDLKPTRMLALWPMLTHFTAAFLEDDVVCRMTVIVARDGVARRVCSATSSPDEVARAIEERYVAPRGSGAFSLENALLAVMVELSDLLTSSSTMIDGTPPPPCSSGPTPNNSGGGADVLLLCGSVTTIDPGDVTKTINDYVARGSAVGVPRWTIISLDGAPHILQHLAAVTGGELHCPMHAEHLARQLLSLCPTRRRDPGHMDRLKSDGGSSQRNVRLMHVGFVGHPSVPSPRCPVCHSSLSSASVPAPCGTCGTPIVHLSVAAAAIMASRRIDWRDITAATATTTPVRVCAACHEPVPPGEPAFICDMCADRGALTGEAPYHECLCAQCQAFADSQLHWCPLCGAVGA